MAKFQIRKLPNNRFRFTMKADNGQTILTSESYLTKDICLRSIEFLKEYAMDKTRYEFKKSLNLKHYFNVTDVSGKVIGSSEMYESSSGRDVGVELLKLNAATTAIEDLTL